MGYATNVMVSLPMAIIMFMLTQKLIMGMTSESKYMDRIQKSFIIGFITGLLFIVLGLTMFSDDSNMNNKAIQYALYWAGSFLVINTVFFSWDDLDEGTKIILLGIMVSGLIIYSYRNK